MTKIEKQFKMAVDLSMGNIFQKSKSAFVEDKIKVELPFELTTKEQMKLYFARGGKDRSKNHINILFPVWFLRNQPSSFVSSLSNLLKTYGIALITIDQDEYFALEDSNKPLHIRVRNMLQAVLALDGILRARNLIVNGNNSEVKSGNKLPQAESSNARG